MKKFLAIYRGEPSADWDKLPKEEQNKRVQLGMEGWGRWMQKHSSSIVDTGGPLGKTLEVSKSGIATKKNKDCGYVLIEAETHEEAAKKFMDHPHFSIFPGENVEIMECLPIPGQA